MNAIVDGNNVYRTIFGVDDVFASIHLQFQNCIFFSPFVEYDTYWEISWKANCDSLQLDRQFRNMFSKHCLLFYDFCLLLALALSLQCLQLSHS